MFTPPECGKDVKTTCAYCGVGCGVIARRETDGRVSVKGDKEHPANFGRLCSKGSALDQTVDLEGRLLAPEINGHRASWDQSLDLVAQKFTETIAEHGPDSVAFYVSGQILTEDYYVANKLIKGFIGTANIDTNSRLCMASSVAGHKRAFGSDTVPGTYEDLELADLIVLVGSNLAWCHPVIYQRIEAAKKARPEMNVVLIDPRRTMTSELADLHLSIKPDGDLALFSGLLTYLSHTDALDFDYINTHTNGFMEALQLATEQSEPARLREKTGLSSEELKSFYEMFASTKNTVTVFSQGVNQSVEGTDKVNAIINCHLATGRIGKPGMGPFSITGQPNAMGGREVGGLANMLAAHMDIENSEHRSTVQRFWNSPTMVEKPGLKAVDMFRAVADGRIKAIWIMSTNPVVSLPEADNVAAALKDCPFVVVSDILKQTDTTAYADVLLPAAGWGEKDGTVTNSERRISRQRQFLPLPGEVKPDWWQLAEVGKRMGFADAFSYSGTAEIFAEHAALSAFENDNTRDFDIGSFASINAKEFDVMRPFQWPQPEGLMESTTRFFTNGNFYTPDKRARFVAVESRPTVEPDLAHRFILNTGRVRDHWHTMTRSGKSPRLSQHIAEPFAELNPEDALKLGVRHADIVRVENRYGSVLVRADVTAQISKGQVFVPIHWSNHFASKARINVVVPVVVDPVSGQPASKNCAVSVSKFNAAYFGFAITTKNPVGLDQDYWAIGKIDGGWKMELASANTQLDPEALARKIFGISDLSQCITYRDENLKEYRIAAFENGKLIGVLYLSTKPVAVARNWITQQLETDCQQGQQGHQLIAGQADDGRLDPGAIVCACFAVGTNQIVSAIMDEGCRSVDAIGQALKAGTNCGSCRSEIKGIIDNSQVIAAE